MPTGYQNVIKKYALKNSSCKNKKTPFFKGFSYFHQYSKMLLSDSCPRLIPHPGGRVLITADLPPGPVFD